MLPTTVRIVVLLPLVALAVACGRPNPKAEAEVRKIDDSEKDADAGAAAKRERPAWQRSAVPMPETFAGFPRPDLAALDGVWLVDAELPGRAAVWVVEDQGSKLTMVDRHQQERIHGVTLSSPCALRLTDDNGRAQARAVAQLGEQLILSSKGSIAVASPDGDLLACVGHRTYQIAADGRCRYTTEMLGVWSDPIDAKDACKLETVDKKRVLTIAGQQLHEREGGVWLDEVAAADVAKPLESRAAGLALLNPPAEPAAAAEQAGSETGEAKPGETG